jgi:anti-anti-sigma factor
MRPTTTEAAESREPDVGSLFASVRLPASPGAVRLHLTGELNLATADRARVCIRHAQDDAQVLICDLAALWFIDLIGLRVLLDAAALAERTGRRLIIVNAPPILPRLLGVLKLDDALEVADAPLRTPPSLACDGFRRHVS